MGTILFNIRTTLFVVFFASMILGCTKSKDAPAPDTIEQPAQTTEKEELAKKGAQNVVVVNLLLE